MVFNIHKAMKTINYTKLLCGLGGDYMKFAKGILIGGLIGASISVLTNPDIVDPRMRKRLIKSGKKIVRRSSNVFEDMIHMFR